MATLTKAEAARQLGISRTTLYKLIDQGTLSATPEGLIDTAELGRVMSTVDVHRARPRTLVDSKDVDTSSTDDEHHRRPGDLSSEQHAQVSSERQLTSSVGEGERPLTSSYRDLVDILREQLQAAQERERDYREHIARLTAMLDQAHQQNQRLLDMPRARPQDSPGPTPARRRPLAPAVPPRPPGTPLNDARGTMRRQIVALLEDYAEGLTPREMRTLLGATKRLAQTCLGMRRDGLLRRVERGRYALP